MALLALSIPCAEHVTIKIGSASVQNGNHEKLQGITIDNKLTFEYLVAELCQKS